MPKQSKTRRINKTKVTSTLIRRINSLVYKNRELTGLQIKNKLNLNLSPRTIRRYVNFLGWKKIKTRQEEIIYRNFFKKNLIFCSH